MNIETHKPTPRWFEGHKYFKFRGRALQQWESKCGQWMDSMPSHASKEVPQCPTTCQTCIGFSLNDIEESID